MPKKSWIAKQKRPAKFSTRAYNRCSLSGRRRAYLRKFGVSRIQFREMVLRGEIPGVMKASW